MACVENLSAHLFQVSQLVQMAYSRLGALVLVLALVKVVLIFFAPFLAFVLVVHADDHLFSRPASLHCRRIL